MSNCKSGIRFLEKPIRWDAVYFFLITCQSIAIVEILYIPIAIQAFKLYQELLLAPNTNVQSVLQFNVCLNAIGTMLIEDFG